MLAICAVSPSHPDAQAAMGGMWEYLEAIFGDGDLEGFLRQDVCGVDGFFLVAYWGGGVAGCVALRSLGAGVGEVKRMYVTPEMRGKGIARALLLELEGRAREQGRCRLILETSTLQPEAVRLYESCGYVAIPPYGKYADDPVTLCFAKELSVV